MKSGKIILAELRDDLLISKDNTTSLVIFPAGKHNIVASDGNDNPVELTVDVNFDTFQKIKASLNNIKDKWTDFNHKEESASSWLVDILYNINKGIVATVKLTAEGLEAIKGKMFKYFSPSFYVNEAGEITSLADCFGSFTNKPAFETLKKYPIQAEKKDLKIMSNEIKTEDAKQDTKQEIKAEEKGEFYSEDKEKETPAEETKESPAEEAKEPAAEEKKEDDKQEEKQEGGKTETEKWVEACNQSLKNYGERLDKLEAMYAEKFGQVEEKIGEVNAEQCKIHDALTVASEKMKEDITKTIVKAEQNVDGKPADEGKQFDLVIKAQALMKEKNLSFDKAWRLVSSEIKYN